jgi:hypothetical protein
MATKSVAGRLLSILHPPSSPHEYTSSHCCLYKADTEQLPNNVISLKQDRLRNERSVAKLRYRMASSIYFTLKANGIATRSIGIKAVGRFIISNGRFLIDFHFRSRAASRKSQIASNSFLIFFHAPLRPFL